MRHNSENHFINVLQTCLSGARILLLLTPLCLTACWEKNDIDTVPPTDTAPPVDTLPPKVSSGIIINEAVSSNAEHLDDDGDDSDWFELHNTSSEPVALYNWTVSDNLDKPYKWTLPDVVLGSNEVLLIWASGKNRANDVTAPLHTNFKLSSDGETLSLYDGSGALVDSLYVQTSAGMSVGVSINDGSVVYYDDPSPGTLNGAMDYAGALSSTVKFSHQGGILSAQNVRLLTNDADTRIHYTLDSTVPTEESPLYVMPIAITDNTVIRARAFRDRFIPSATQSRTYLVERSHDIAVVTLVTEPSNFFDIDTGIYSYGSDFDLRIPYFGANFWQDWERDIHFSFYEPNGVLGTAFDAGVKIFGGWSRAHDQRSLSIFARGRYGTSEIEYPFFNNRDYDEFQALVLRNSGTDWLVTMMRDAAMTSLMESADIDVQAFRPVATYLNGEYWGMYNLREKVNEHFLASKHDVDADDVDLMELNGLEVEGSNQEYLALIDFVTEHDLSEQSNYDVVAEQIDINNYIAYQIAQIYFNNTDWPHNNIKYWKSPETKWRWILYDTDFGSGLHGLEAFGYNTLAYALDNTYGGSLGNFRPPWSTRLFSRLMENQEFRERFINQFADELNSRFLAQAVGEHIDQIAAVIASEMPGHFERWAPADFAREWQAEVELFKEFFNLRPEAIIEHILNQFELVNAHTLSIENNNVSAGYVRVNSLTISEAMWQGRYFEGIPIELTAVANEGFEFIGWTGIEAGTESSVTLNLTGAQTVQPMFAPIP